MFIRRALFSVSDKTGLVEFARALHEQGVELVATSGTGASLMAAGLPVVSVSDVTRFPDAFLGGRVKTLQPALYAGLLADRDNPDHLRDLGRHAFTPIDLLCLNLYPFGGTDQDDHASGSAITHIDIGGPMLLRAAALNYRHVAVVTRPQQYDDIVRTLKRNRNELSEDVLARLASQAFALVASYEAQVSAWFAEHHGEIAGENRRDAQRIDWIKCRACGGATASERTDACLRHLEPVARRRELQLLDGWVDLRNVQVTPSLLAEVLGAFAGRDGRPRLNALRCEWTQFEGPVSMEAAIIDGDLDLSGARFVGSLNCSDVSVAGECRCRDTRFRVAAFERLRVESLATFRGADFRQVSFDAAEFSGPAVFEAADFASATSFRGTVFHRDCSFIGATFHDEANFVGATWHQDSRFRDASFAKEPQASEVARFREASWPMPGDSEAVQDDAMVRATPTGPLVRVFIGSSAESLDVARAVQQNLDHEVETLLWTQGPLVAGSVASLSLQSAIQEMDFAVFVLAADDPVVSRGQQWHAPRDNVLWECGLATGLLGPNRTFLLKPRGLQVKIPSDLGGAVLPDYDASRRNLRAATGAACTDILDAVKEIGRR